MKNIKNITIGLFLFALLIAGYFFVISKPSVAELKPEVAPKIAKIAGIDVQMSAKDESRWQITTATPTVVMEMPLGSFVGMVASPPQSRDTISVPMNITIKNLLVQKYENVSKGQLLATASSPEWLAAQQQLLGATISSNSQRVLANNKNILCSEGIVAKKECVIANSDLAIKNAEANIAKSLLRSYGASSSTISRIVNSSSIEPLFEIRSTIGGAITDMNATNGMSFSMLAPLFKIQGKSAVWIESEISEEAASMINIGDSVMVDFNSKKFNSKILQKSSMLNGANQSIGVRFRVPSDISMIAGQKATLKVSKPVENILKIPKNAVSIGTKNSIVFVKKQGGFKALPINALSSDSEYFYVQSTDELNAPIATNGVVVLKTIMEGSGD
jgi:cobalt-zinc-cadmium efflux system membrane fusion protein